jgi:hypothetical protein
MALCEGRGGDRRSAFDPDAAKDDEVGTVPVGASADQAMKPALHRFGASQSPVVVVDDFSGELDGLVDAAAAMAPLPRLETNYYPGLRRVISEGDGAVYARIETLLEQAAPFIGGGFDTNGFDLLEASFSMVTTPPDKLTPPQRAPHFDSSDPKYLAVLMYVSDTAATGTAFYRQRATGIETVNEGNLQRFVATARMATSEPGYISHSNKHYEQIGRIDAVPNRLIVYQGCLLHSGIIPPSMSFSSDPRQGRLTVNIFIRAH